MTTATAFPKRDAAKRLLTELRAESPQVQFGSVESDPQSGVMWIDGIIGARSMGQANAIDVRQQLALMKSKKVTVYVNSRGGSVDEGISVYNELMSHAAGVNTICNGIAASIASYIFQSGQRRVMAPNSTMMIHSPWSRPEGNDHELMKEIEILQKYKARMVDVYALRSGKSRDEVISIMENESWFSAAEAVTAGFADVVQTAAEQAGNRYSYSLAGQNEVARQRAIQFPRRTLAKRLSLQLMADECRAAGCQ